MPVQASSPLLRGAAEVNNRRGIALMALGMFLFAAVDTLAKVLTEHLHPFQIVWSRQLGLLLGVVILLLWKGPGLLRTEHRWVQISRGVLAVGSATCFIFALRYVPIADAVAVSFVAPFMVTLMGAALLKEPVGLRRWIAVGVGFLGTLVVIRPGMNALHPAVFLVVVAAFAFAARQIVSRMLSGDSIMTTVTYTALVSTALLTLPLPFVWSWPQSPQVWLLLCAMALLTAFGETCVIAALQFGQAVAVAPLQYTLILWGTCYGFLVFGDLPDGWTWIGAAIIVASGLYTLWRERIRVSNP